MLPLSGVTHQVDALALAHDGRLDGPAVGRLGDQPRQVTDTAHPLAIELGDDIALLDTRLFGGASGAHLVDDGAALVLVLSGIDVPDRHAQLRAAPGQDRQVSNTGARRILIVQLGL